MSLQPDFLPEAQTELAEAVDWYEREQAGLGQEFLAEVNARIAAAGGHPELYPIQRRRFRKQLRKIQLSRFHYYSIYFSVEGDIFKIWAVFHGSQNPRKLRSRLR